MATVRAEVERQRQLDSDRGCNLGLLTPRIRAVAGAQWAALGNREGAAPALRQSLIDLSAAAEQLAADMEPVGSEAPR